MKWMSYKSVCCSLPEKKKANVFINTITWSSLRSEGKNLVKKVHQHPEREKKVQCNGDLQYQKHFCKSMIILHVDLFPHSTYNSSIGQKVSISPSS